jgi:hypothetical protein
MPVVLSLLDDTGEIEAGLAYLLRKFHQKSIRRGPGCAINTNIIYAATFMPQPGSEGLRTIVVEGLCCTQSSFTYVKI